MKLNSFGPRASARGLTLIELVVVLAILAALSGLIIGNFPSLLSKSSGSTSANTIQDISRAMSTRFTTKGSYATGFDSLVNTSASPGLFNKLPAASIALLTASAPSAADVTALGFIGVTSVVNLNENASDATWSVATTNNVVNISTSTPLALAGSALQAKLLPATNGYTSPVVYIMGVGRLTSLIGPDSILLEAPTRTGSSPLDNSQNFYQRYCVAFLIDGASGSRRARFLGSLAPSATGFDITDDATKTYNNN